MSDSHAHWLRRAADEIAKAGHYGWGNTCEDAAEHIDALEAELAALRAELESAHAAQRNAETELSQYMAWYAMAEHQHLHEQRRAEKAEAERDALRKVLLDEAEYCYGYARKYEGTDEDRAKRHRERGDRLKRAALEAER